MISAENRLGLSKAEGLRQEDAAREMENIPYRTYRRYETGECEPGAVILIKMADFYGAAIDYLVGRTDQ